MANFIDFCMQTAIAFLVYGSTGILTMLAVCSHDVHAENAEERKAWNKEYKRNEESRRIGFLMRLKEER